MDIAHRCTRRGPKYALAYISCVYIYVFFEYGVDIYIGQANSHALLLMNVICVFGYIMNIG